MKPNACDTCGRERSTLYESANGLICYYCLPAESLRGVGALRAILTAVTGALNIERRRSSRARARGRVQVSPGGGLRCST
jgi:hypothetical protein